MRYFLLTLLAMFFFASCEKKPEATSSRENTLRAGRWKLASGTITVKNPNGRDTTLNYLDFIPECYKDDYLVFDSLNHGKRFTGENVCSPADPEYFAFIWQLKGNGEVIDLFNGLNYIYGVVDSIQLYRFDTLSKDPYLVLDTVVGALDTIEAFRPKIIIELDTIRELRYSGVPGGIGPTGETRGGFDIYDADLKDVDEGSFTLHFRMYSSYPDSTVWHSASYQEPINDYSNPGEYPAIRPDTFKYELKFTNF